MVESCDRTAGSPCFRIGRDCGQLRCGSSKVNMIGKLTRYEHLRESISHRMIGDDRALPRRDRCGSSKFCATEYQQFTEQSVGVWPGLKRVKRAAGLTLSRPVAGPCKQLICGRSEFPGGTVIQKCKVSEMLAYEGIRTPTTRSLPSAPFRGITSVVWPV